MYMHNTMFCLSPLTVFVEETVETLLFAGTTEYLSKRSCQCAAGLICAIRVVSSATSPASCPIDPPASLLSLFPLVSLCHGAVTHADGSRTADLSGPTEMRTCEGENRPRRGVTPGSRCSFQVSSFPFHFLYDRFARCRVKLSRGQEFLQKQTPARRGSS